MSERPLLVLAAMRIEADAIESAAASARGLIRIIGPGAKQMPEILNPEKPRGIILAGIGGGLDPQLRCGDVVIDELSDLRVDSIPFRRGGIHTSDRIVWTARQKQELFQKTGALVVDMESAIVRARAKEAGVPFLGIRAVSDTAGESLDPALFTLIDESGRTKPAAVAAALLRRPALLGELLRARSSSRIALSALAEAVGNIINLAALTSWSSKHG